MTFRRILGSVAAAAALTLAPAGAALGYGGADEFVAVSDTNPESGEPFQVVVDAGTESPEATLTVSSDDPAVSDDSIEIAGTQSMTKQTTAAGTAEFTVTLHVEGAYSLVGTDASGNVVGESTVVVGDGEPGGAEGGSGDDAAGAGGGTNVGGSLLPDTGAGSTTTLLAAGGGLLVLGGVTALVLSRRRGAQVG